MMRVTSDELDAEVAGTTVADRLEIHAWRGGQLVAEALLVTEWALRWDADRDVQGQATFVFSDPDGELAPWGFGDALAPGGSRLQVTWVSGMSGTRVPLGWWRIRTAEPYEQWRVYPHGGGATRRVPGGGSVTVTADEEMATAQLNRLDAEVITAPTCLAEVTRLLSGICQVTVHPDVTDKPVPRSLVYGESRVDAVMDLLQVVGAAYRMGPDGAFEVVPAAGVGPVWTLAGGDGGVLVAASRSMSDEGVYNAVTSTGETPTGAPLVGRDVLQTGPLAYGGPFGEVVLFHRAIATTRDGVLADAATLLRNRAAAGESDLDVTCLTHPALQVNDRVTVLAATSEGDEPITGRVVGMTMRSASSDDGTVPAKAMTCVVRVPAQALEAIARRVRRG